MALPFLMALPAIGSALGKIFGGASEGSANADVARQNAALSRDQLLNQAYQAQQNAQTNAGQLDLQRKRFSSDEEGTRLRRALVGQLLGNAQPLNIEMPGMPKSTGGLSVASLGQGGRDTGALMAMRALQQLQQGDQFQGGEILQAPGVSPLGRQGGNRFLNFLGTMGSVLGGFGGGGAQQAAQAAMTPSVNTGRGIMQGVRF